MEFLVGSCLELPDSRSLLYKRVDLNTFDCIIFRKRKSFIGFGRTCVSVYSWFFYKK